MPISFIDDLVSITGPGTLEPRLQQLVDGIGRPRARIVAIELLSWFQRQNRFFKDRPLKLDFDHRWCVELKELMETWAEMGSLLKINGNECNFRENVSEESREKIRDLATSCYRPVVRT